MSKLSNIEGRPLEGRRIAVTRPPAQAVALITGLLELGATPIESPTIRIEDPPDPAPLRRAMERLGAYDWIVFTSANGVERFWAELDRSSSAGELPEGIRLAAIGPATAEAVERRGLRLDVVPSEYVAEAVAEALTAADGMAGRRILLPRAAGARQVLPERLRAAGAEVDEIVAYESRPDPEGIEALRAAIESDSVDMVTFTAASTVRHYVEVAGPDMGAARVAVIGPITARAARDAGVRVDAEASEYTVAGLLREISNYFAGIL
jgi:uroporphyrinogen III methyltransferase/synthase